MNNAPSIAFPPALYARYEVDGLSPDQIDELLANGWFRQRLLVCTEVARFMGDEWRSCLMLRIPLGYFSWKKRLSKLLAKNDRLFTTVCRPFSPSEEMENLWQHFKSTVHHWGYIPPLKIHLLKEASPQDFQTWELCVYHDSRLVAFSIFDRGRNSLASLEAAYDPAYRKYSLGIYTMLLEIAYAKAEGMDYYYPGFLPKDVPMFEYKLRPGCMQFFRLRNETWTPWENLQEDDWLYDSMKERLEHLGSLLNRQYMVNIIGYGHHIFIPGHHPPSAAYNVFLLVKKWHHSTYWDFLAAWDPLLHRYFLFTFQQPEEEKKLSSPRWHHILNLAEISNFTFVSAFDKAEHLARII